MLKPTVQNKFLKSKDTLQKCPLIEIIKYTGNSKLLLRLEQKGEHSRRMSGRTLFVESGSRLRV